MVKYEDRQDQVNIAVPDQTGLSEQASLILILERSDSVVECLTGDREAADSSLFGTTAL